MRDWVLVAQDLPNRGRAQCRNRFQFIYTLFKRNPLTALESIVYGAVKSAHRKQRRVYDTLDEAFRCWWAAEQRAGTAAAGSETLIGLPGVDPQGRTVLPSGLAVVNRDLFRFIRHLQARLPVTVARPLEPLPRPHRRTLPSAKVEELPDRPLHQPR